MKIILKHVSVPFWVVLCFSAIVYSQNNQYDVKLLKTWGGTGSQDGQFIGVQGVTVDITGNVYVADMGNYRIQKFSCDGTFLTKWITEGQPVGLKTGPDGAIWVTCFGTGIVQKYSPDGSLLSKLVSIANPRDIAFDKYGYIYIASSEPHIISKYGVAGNLLARWGIVSCPSGMTIDNADHIYVAECFSDRIDKFSLDGELLLQWGRRGEGDGEFKGPYKLTTDKNGNVLVTEIYNNFRVQIFSPNGVYIYKWDVRQNIPNQSHGPSGIGLDATGKIFVGEYAGTDPSNPGESRISVYVNNNDNPPIANAGSDQTVHIGSLVTLDGSGSTDLEADYPLSYSWGMVSKPEGSFASILNPNAIAPNFTVDLPGEYSVQLVVVDSKGSVSQPETVFISTTNSAPIAEAGSNIAVQLLGTAVQLDGSQSYDPDGDPISYAWTIIQKPQGGSMANLTASNTKSPTIVPDVYGDYILSLIVNDTWINSAPDNMTISFNNLKPVAIPGNSQSCVVGNVVYLDGSASNDPNGDTIISYLWNIVSKPLASNAQLITTNTFNPSILPDIPGEYVLSLVVSDGLLNSDPVTVSIAAISFQNAASQNLQQAISIINSLPVASFVNVNMSNTLNNKINSVLLNIDQGSYQASYNQLSNDVLKKINGCAISGVSDKTDWIKYCQDQEPVYQALMQALRYLSDLLR